MLALLEEQVVQQPADRLGPIALPLVHTPEGKADLGVAWVVGTDQCSAVADQQVGAAQGC